MKLLKTLLFRMLLSMHLVLAGTLLLSETSFAAKGGNGNQQSSGGLDGAVASIQQQTGGRVLRASQKGSVYIIKVLMPSGVVKTFHVSAQ